MATTPPERLARIAEMLGSSHEGERATAAQMATQVIRSMGLTWTDVILRGLGAGPPRPQSQQPAEPSDGSSYVHGRGHAGHRCDEHLRTKERNGVPAWRWVDTLLNHHGSRLSGWEVGFLRALRGRGKATPKHLELTSRQWWCLEAIADRLKIIELGGKS